MNIYKKYIIWLILGITLSVFIFYTYIRDVFYIRDIFYNTLDYFLLLIKRLDNYFLHNTEKTEHLSYAISVITAIIVAIPAFLLPLFFNVFEDKIKNNTANPDFIFDEIMKKYSIKLFYILIFLFIVHLFLQNYIKILYYHSLTLSINAILTISIIYITYKLLNAIILKESRLLIKEIYDFSIKNFKENKKDYKIIVYLYLKDLNKFILDNNIDNFNSYLKDFKKYIININTIEFYLSYVENTQINKYQNFKSLITDQSVILINQNENFFNNILKFYLNQDTYNFIIENHKKDFLYQHFIYCFQSLNDILWKQNIETKSNYIISNSLKNQYQLDIFTKNCKNIIEYIEIQYFLIQKYKDKDFDYLIKIFYAIQLPSLNIYIYCICQSLISGNKDSIYEFIEALIFYCDKFFINNSLSKNEYWDIRTQLIIDPNNQSIINSLKYFDCFDYINMISANNEIENYNNKKDIKSQLFILKLYKYKLDTIKKIIVNKSILYKDSEIMDYLVRNTFVDSIFDMFNIFSSKYFEYLEENKNEDIFILNVIKKLVKFQLENRKNYQIYNINIFNNGNNLFFSILRLFIFNKQYPLSNIRINNQDRIKIFFKNSYSGVGKVMPISYYDNLEFGIILLLYYSIDINTDNLIKTLLFLFNDYIDMVVYKENFISFRNILNNIKYNNYKEYIENVFENFSEEIFNNNKQKLLDKLENIIKKLDELEFKRIKNSKINETKINNIINNIKEEFKNKISSYLSFFNKIDFNKSIKRIKENFFSINIQDKKSNFLENNYVYYDYLDVYNYYFYDNFTIECIRKLLYEIKEVENTKNTQNITLKKFIDEYLNDNENFIFAYRWEILNEKIFDFKRTTDYFYDSNKFIAFVNKINNFNFRDVPFLEKFENPVVIIPKKFFKELDVDLNSLSTNFEEEENNKIIITISCYYKVIFDNQDKNNKNIQDKLDGCFNEIKIINIKD